MATINTKYPFAGSVETKQGGRNENQDNAGFIDTPLGLLLVVCDGMGGGPGGRTASLMAVDTILTVLADVSDQTPREDALRFGIEKANDIIYSKAVEIPELRGMGTTVAAILINEDSAMIAHVGDTRIYQLRKGKIEFRSADHSVVADLVRQKKITEEQARNHPQSNIITRALGIRPNVEIEFDEVTFLRGDRFVVCTDGIWGMLPEKELVRSFSRVMGIGELTTLITEEIDNTGKKNGGGHDNLTLAILDSSFDSALKKVKSKKRKDDKSSSKKTWFHRATAVIVVFLVIFAFIFYYPNPSSQYRQDSQQRPIKGETVTTVDTTTIKIAPNDSSGIIPIETVNPIGPIVKEEIRKPLEDSTIIKSQEIKRQISHVIKNLDRLKIINGRNMENAQKNKRKFVKDTIEPDVNRLGEKVQEKRKDINDIIIMLKDKKTVLSNRRGQTTPESKRHIESIKNKVIRLQN